MLQRSLDRIKRLVDAAREEPNPAIARGHVLDAVDEVRRILDRLDRRVDELERAENGRLPGPLG